MDDARSRWLAEADQYLTECHRASASVRASEFALRMRRTPVQLAREFQASVGHRLKDYFTRRQIERAKELLRMTSRSTAEIAADSGYGTTRSFFRAFRRATGMSPTEYRKNCP